MSASPRVFPIVLNHQHDDDTLRCLASLRRSTYRNQFPVVVDNGSRSEVSDRLGAALGSTTYLRSDDNLGYAGGNNLAIRYALERDADFVWVLNPDASVEADALEGMLEVAARHPEDGLFGARVLYGGSRPLTVSSDGGLLAADGSATNRHDGLPVDQLDGTGSLAADYVTGSSLLVRTEVFRDVGLLPEEYFLYFEETDFAVAARSVGWGARVALAARVHHYKRSFGETPKPYYVYYYIRGRLLFAQRNEGGALDAAERSLDPFIHGWRDRVSRATPGWLATFDELVERALDDGRAGVTGRVDDIHAMPVAGPAA